jgi:hypothetical protein
VEFELKNNNFVFSVEFLQVNFSELIMSVFVFNGNLYIYFKNGNSLPETLLT